MSDWWTFEFYSSIPFWAAVGAVAVVARVLGSAPRARAWSLLVASCALLLALPRFRPMHLVLVLAISTIALVFARLVAGDGRSATPGRRRVLASAGVLCVLGFLCFFKYRFLQDLVPNDLLPRRGDAGARGYLFLIGASYFTFKAIHVIVEAYKGTIADVEGVTFLTYMTFFPAFISGPISRYDQFAAQLGQDLRGTLRADLTAGGERLVHGLFKKFVLVPIVFPHVLGDPAHPLAQATFAGTAFGLYAYALYFYFDFSGYTDLAIGGARLVGVGLPENFERPFLQRNIRALWASWHMSLTSWLIDYVYWPVVRKLRNLEPLRTRPVLLSVIGMIVTFVACGVWHGEALNFVLWGVYHGLGISAFSVYQRQKKRIRSAPVQRWFRSPTSRVLGSFATFNFFAAGLALFVLDVGQLRQLLTALVHRGTP